MQCLQAAQTKPLSIQRTARSRLRRVAPGSRGRGPAQLQAAAAPDVQPDQQQQATAYRGAGAPSLPSAHQVISDEQLLPPLEHYGLAHDKQREGSNYAVKHMPSSLFANFPKLPPDGSTITPEEAKCDPETERCHTPIHVWEAQCTVCSGTGTARTHGSHSRHRTLSICLLCHGLGYVRHSTTHPHTVPYVNGSGPNTTIGRPPPPEPRAHRFHWPGSGGGSHSNGSTNGNPLGKK